MQTSDGVQTKKLGFSGVLQLCVMFDYGCTWLSNWSQIGPVYAGELLSIPSPSSLVPIIILELNNAGTVCIIVESWLKVTTPDGTNNVQCNWEFLGVVFGEGRKLTSYGGDKKLWNWNTWSRKVLVADNRTVIFVCLSVILLGIVYLSINQSIIIPIGIVYQPFNQSFNQFIHPSIHQIDCLFHTEKHIAFLWLNNMLLLAVQY